MSIPSTYLIISTQLCDVYGPVSVFNGAERSAHQFYVSNPTAGTVRTILHQLLELENETLIVSAKATQFSCIDTLSTSRAATKSK